MPALLHKKYRGRGCDLGAELEAYGAVKVSTGVAGAELLSAREAKLAAKGKLGERDGAKEWAGGGSDDNEDEDSDEEGGESPVEVNALSIST